MLGRLFKGLEQGVEGLSGEHMNFINDDDLELRAGGHEADVFFQLANFLNTPVGGTVDFVQINRTACHDLFAGAAFVAGFRRFTLFAVYRLGHDPGKGSFAGTAHPAEDQGMGDPVLQEAVLQGTDNGFLADHLGKGLGSGFSG